MNQKRIVIFGWASSVHVKRWVKGLIERGYAVKVISSGGEMIDDVETVIFPHSGKLSYFKYSKKAKEEALKFNPDIIHVHYAGGFGWWGVKCKFSPMVVSIWGSDIEKLTGNFIVKQIVKKALNKADLITATGYYLKKETVKINSQLEAKIEIVPFGVELPLEPFEFPIERPFKICYIKAHRLVYGPDVLLKAMAKVIRVIPEIELSLTGTGEQTEYLIQLIEELRLSNNVKLVGYIDNKKMYDFIREHHLMVMPSRREGFGVAVLEASACCRPVIATNVGGIPEVLIDGETGLLVPADNQEKLADAIIKMAKDMNYARELGETGYGFVKKNYSWEHSLDKMCKLYERLTNDAS